MPKADKHTKQQRVEQIMRLLVLCAEPSEIRRHVEAQNWKISDRQLRRYVAAARKLFAKVAERNRKQALGQHQKQREALYKQAMKDGDKKLALAILKDQARLQGLYPEAKTAAGAHDDPLKTPAKSSSLTRSERVARLLAAESRGDEAEAQLLLEAMPWRFYRVPDTTLAVWQLHVLRNCHLAEQSDHLRVFLIAASHIPHDPKWLLIAQLAAYRIQMAEEGWREFLRSVGCDAFAGLELAPSDSCESWHDGISALAPTRRDLAAAVRSIGIPAPALVTAADFAKRWQRAYAMTEVESR